MNNLVWKEISRSALASNISQLRKLVGDDRILCPCVKSNAYGHGLIEAAGIFVEAGADWLSVNSLSEARELRDHGIKVPIYVMGYILLEELVDLRDLNEVRIVVYNSETVDQLGALGFDINVHLKLETGNNRQGLREAELIDLVKQIQKFPNIRIEGVATHFANIEDTTDHSYAELQLSEFKRLVKVMEDQCGVVPKIKHCANSAATLLFEETYFDMVRPGIISYGMWPSRETYLSYQLSQKSDFEPCPALVWKTRIAQIKTVPEGQFIGYGCTFRTSRLTKVAILPVGYYDGYDRGIKGAHVLVRGKRAAVLGRVCMNMIMVDVTDIDDVDLEDEAVLIGKSGLEFISAEEFAGWVSTINYEVTTRLIGKIKVI